jgi:hypothetical protein
VAPEQDTSGQAAEDWERAWPLVEVRTHGSHAGPHACQRLTNILDIIRCSWSSVVTMLVSPV